MLVEIRDRLQVALSPRRAQDAQLIQKDLEPCTQIHLFSNRYGLAMRSLLAGCGDDPVVKLKKGNQNLT